jgi:hypothetical protein
MQKPWLLIVAAAWLLLFAAVLHNRNAGFEISEDWEYRDDGGGNSGNPRSLSQHDDSEEKLSPNSSVDEKFSIVMQGYQPGRIPNFERIFNVYGNMKDDVDKIIVVWSNLKADPPLVPKNLPVDVVILRASTDHITNRYNVSDTLRTKALIEVDDDLLLSPALMRCMFEYWRKDPSRLIGVDLDTRIVKRSGRYMNPLLTRKANRGGLYNVILTKSMMFSSDYLKAFFDDPIISRTSDAMRTGEDIGMNALVSNLTRKPPLAVRSDKSHRRVILNEIGGLSGCDKKKGGCVKGHITPERNTFSKAMLEHFGQDVFRNTTEIAKCTAQKAAPPVVAQTVGFSSIFIVFFLFI